MTTMQEVREKQIQELDDFIESSKQKLNMILSRLDWSVENITKNVTNFVVCPFNESHHVMEKSIDKHLEDCQWRAEGYGKEDLPLSIPSLPSGAPSSIKFDEQLQDEVIQSAVAKNPSMLLGAGGRLIPRTSDRFTADFTRDEKCAMYEYVIANTVEPDLGDDIADMNKPKSSSEGKTSSYLELLAQERNLKRRRAKYRGVHTNKKSQVEILREVVNQQMEMLAEYLAEKQKLSSGSAFRDLPKKEKLDEADAGDENLGKIYRNFRRTEKEHSRDFRNSCTGDDASRHRSNNEKNQYEDVKEDSRNFRWLENKNDREIYRKTEKRRERENSRDSSESKRRKSDHKKHKHRSKDRRSRSRDRDKKSRSHRDSKHEKRKSDRSKHSRHDDRDRTKRERS